MSNKDLEWLFSKTRDKGYKYEGIAFTFADLILTCSERSFLHGLGRNICMIWKDSVMSRAFITLSRFLFSAWKGKTCIKWYIYFLKELFKVFNAFFYISSPDFIAFSMYVPCIAIDYLCHNWFRIKASHWPIAALRWGGLTA